MILPVTSTRLSMHFTGDDIECLLHACTELWAAAGDDPHDQLSARQRELLDRACALTACDPRRVVFTVEHATPARFAVDEHALATWVAESLDDLDGCVPDDTDEAPGNAVSNLVNNAVAAGVLVGDPDLALQVHGDDDSLSSGFYVLLHNRHGLQRKVGLTTGWTEFDIPDKRLPLIDGIRDCLEQVVSVANGLLVLVAGQS